MGWRQLRAAAWASVFGAFTAAQAGEPVMVQVSGDGSMPKRPAMGLSLAPFSLDTTVMSFPSGLRVLFQGDDASPVVAITAVTDHGASSDPEELEGLAHLVEHLWFRAKHANLPKVWDVLQSEMGCGLNAFTNYDVTTYSTICPSSQFHAMMKLESLRISDTVAGVTPEVLSTEIDVVRNEIRMRTENYNIPFFTMLEFVNKTLYPDGHPYSRTMAGDHESIRNVRLEDVHRFVDAYYRPNTTTISVVGDIGDTSPNALLDVLVRSFDLSLLHPELNASHLRKVPRPGIANPDHDNENHWYLVPLDPEKPTDFLSIKTVDHPRNRSFAGVEATDAASSELATYVGPVEEPTVAVAWPLPPAYQGHDQAFGVLAGFVYGAMSQGLVEDPWAERPKPLVRGVKEFGGCGPLLGKHGTTLICTATVEKDHSNPGYVAERMLDQIASMPSTQMLSASTFMRDAFQRSFKLANHRQMARILHHVDVYSSIFSGRASTIGTYAHFTGSPDAFSDALRDLGSFDLIQALTLKDQYLNRSQAAMVYVKPLSREELTATSSDTVGAGGHARGGLPTSVLSPTIDPSQISDRLLRQEFESPNTGELREWRLSNGLRVVALDHGSAPMLSVKLIVGNEAWGSSATEDFLSYYFATAYDRERSRYRNGLAAMRGEGRWDQSEYVSIDGSPSDLGELLWLLRGEVEDRHVDLTWLRSYAESGKRRLAKGWHRVNWHVGDLRRKHLYPDTPRRHYRSWDRWDAIRDIAPKDIASRLDTKWQPENATLLVVGRIAPEAVLRPVTTYFGSWRPRKKAPALAAVSIDTPAAPEASGIYVFDDEGKTQTDVTLSCRLRPATGTRMAHLLLNDIARGAMMARLREQAGVVYSPRVSVDTAPDETAVMHLSATVQNDSAGFAASTYFDFIEMLNDSKSSETDFAVRKLARARRTVLSQQSVGQMSSWLHSAIDRGEDFGTYVRDREALVKLQLSDVGALLEGCRETAFVSVVGPVEEAKKRLAEAGLDFEVVDWEARGKALHEAADPGGYARWLKAEEKKEGTAALDEP